MEAKYKREPLAVSLQREGEGKLKMMAGTVAYVIFSRSTGLQEVVVLSVGNQQTLNSHIIRRILIMNSKQYHIREM